MSTVSTQRVTETPESGPFLRSVSPAHGTVGARYHPYRPYHCLSTGLHGDRETTDREVRTEAQEGLGSVFGVRVA